MTIRVAPFTVEPPCNCISTFGHENKEHISRHHVPITYWGIYIDDKHVSFVSSEEMAERTKSWMQKWLR